MLNPWRWLIQVLMMGLTCWLIVACHSQPQSSVPTDCRWVSHAAGETCVPNTVQRLVTLDTIAFEQAIALGLQPIGAPLSEKFPPNLKARLAGVTSIGKSGEPSLERILALKPDLILGLDYQSRLYPQFAQIAPTLLIEFEHSGQWKPLFQRFGQALQREAIAQQVMADYTQRLQTLKAQLKVASNVPGGLPFPPKISVVRVYPDSINLYLRDSFIGTILQDAGLSRPAMQNLSAADADQRFGNAIQVSISLEQIDQADGDALFTWTGEDTAAATERAQKKLKALQSNPLWQTLAAIKTNRTYVVPDYWIGSGPIAANAIIDDLFKFLVPPA